MVRSRKGGEKCRVKIDTDWIVRAGIRTLQRNYDRTEEDIKSLQSVGQIIGEVLCQLDPERCTFVTDSRRVTW